MWESIWWKDLKFIGGNDVTRNEWFAENITFRLGCGINIPFQKAKWVQSYTLKIVYPELFQVRNKPEGNIVETGEWRNDRWLQNFHQNGDNFAIELQTKMEEFCNCLSGVEKKTEDQDTFVWILESNKIFIVKYCYSVIEKERRDGELVE